jgi:hypothetical protein
MPRSQSVPSPAILLRHTIRGHLRPSQHEQILNVFPRKERVLARLGWVGVMGYASGFFKACGLASASISFPSQ